MSADNELYIFMAWVCMGGGFYVGWYFIRLWRTLKLGHYITIPFLVLGLVYMAEGVLFLLTILHVGNLASFNQIGLYMRPLIVGSQIMPYVIARSMVGIK